MATSFVTTADGHGGSLLTQAPQGANQLLPLTTPHAATWRRGQRSPRMPLERPAPPLAWPVVLDAIRRPGRSTSRRPASPSATPPDRRSGTSTSRTRPVGARRPSCSPRTRRAASPPTCSLVASPRIDVYFAALWCALPGVNNSVRVQAAVHWTCRALAILSQRTALMPSAGIP